MGLIAEERGESLLSLSFALEHHSSLVPTSSLPFSPQPGNVTRGLLHVKKCTGKILPTPRRELIRDNASLAATGKGVLTLVEACPGFLVRRDLARVIEVIV